MSDLLKCETCGHCNKQRVYTSDSWEHVEKWTCKNNNKVIGEYIEWNDKISLPDWCPILGGISKTINNDKVKDILNNNLDKDNVFKSFLEEYAKKEENTFLLDLIKSYDKCYTELKKPVTDNTLLIATKILQLLDHNNDLLNHRKLHCLLYLEQGYFLANFGYPLFSEDIEHWITMPTVPSVFNYFKEKGYGARSIIEAPYWNFFVSDDKKEDYSLLDYDTVLELNEDEEKFFTHIFHSFNEYTSDGLMNIIEQQHPWYSTTWDDENKKIITKEKMLKYFKTQLND